MRWSVEFYDTSVESDALAFPATIKAKLIHIMELIETHGPNIGKPHVESIKGKDAQGLFEMRPKGKEGIGRAFYCTVVGRKVIVLHCVIKKADKVRKSDLELAKRRMKEVKK